MVPLTFYFFTFSLSTAQHFLTHGTGKELWDHLILVAHLAPEKTDWEADGRCCFGGARTRSQGFSHRDTVTWMVCYRKGSVSYAPRTPHMYYIRCCLIRVCLGHLDKRNWMQIGSLVSFLLNWSTVNVQCYINYRYAT